MNTEKIDLQNAEFDAVSDLSEAYRRITLTPIVDDDYPMIRGGYENEVRKTIDAFFRNGRFSYLPPTKTPLSFEKFRVANVARCTKWHPAGINSWSPSDWLTAIAGELGELASLVKMMNRERDGLPGNKFVPTKKHVADEIADVLTYLDLFAASFDIDLGKAATEKFNEISERVGFPDRI